MSPASFPAQALRLAGVEKISHALILKGSNPQVLFEEAQGLAAFLNCLEPAPDRRPCGVCAHCRQIGAAVFPYWFTIAPQGAARSIQIRQIRELRAQLLGKAGPGQVKVAALLEAHRMREESQNCLLKTLEEPPEDTVLLLLTDKPQDLLPTIRSRCQVMDFGTAAPPPALTELELALDVVGALGAQGYRAVFDKAAFVDGSRKKRLPEFFAALEFLLRGSLLAQLRPEAGAGDLAAGLPGRLAADSRSLLEALDQVWQAGYLLERNVNSLLILENLFLRLKRLDIRVAEGG
jgi:hypothetical protein